MTEDERTEAAIAFHQELALLKHRQGHATGQALAVCEACGNSIPPERQRAIPGVRLCVQCKEAEEIEGKRWAI
ncbi:MAG: TraR/DksA C4-type zinc finger protein [Methylovulum sp.]|nr:TraR/DksA C4-type zinc finger protein [Methylovulum sp.]